MRRIVYGHPLGGIVIDTPVRNDFGDDDLTDEEIEQRAWDRLPPDAIDPHYVDAEDVPSDRTFRAAWQADLSVDMERARDIWRDRMRTVRVPLLAALDIEYQRADEAGDDVVKAGVVAAKQVLRDVTDDPAIEAAQTADDLKAVWPTCLGDQA